MKKQMRDENLMKISEMADRCITDVPTACILLCYMLYRVEEPMDAELLYDLAVTGGIINFFTYQEAMASILDKGLVRETLGEKHEKLYVITPPGLDCAKKLRNIAAKSYRDEIVSGARNAMRRKRNEKDVVISYETHAHGCHLHVVLKDRDVELLNLKLFTPDRPTAEQLGERILNNPSVLYHDVIEAVMKEHDNPPIDLSDN